MHAFVHGALQTGRCCQGLMFGTFTQARILPRQPRIRVASKRAPVVSRMYGTGGGGRGYPPAPPTERILSIVPYLLPLLDSLAFGKFVFDKVPILASVVLAPLFPLYVLYRGVPFLAFGVFLALYVLVVRNGNISRFIRFNTYQALILDIALIFPQLFSGIQAFSAIPQTITEICSTSVFYAIAIAVGYAVVTNARGQLPDQIPAVSDSVYSQIGPM